MPNEYKPGFKAGTNSFWFTFENGYTVSIQFGPGTYSDNHDKLRDWQKHMKENLHSSNAEVGIWDKDGEWNHPDDWGDDVIGYQTPEQVFELMKWAKEQ